MNIEQRIADLEQRVSILESEATAATAANAIKLDDDFTKKVIESINKRQRKEGLSVNP